MLTSAQQSLANAIWSSLRRCGPYGSIGTSQTMTYLSSCGYPPVLSLPHLSHIQVSEQDLLSLTAHIPLSLPSSLSFFLSLPSPMGMADIFNRTKEMVAGSEKLERQLDGHGLEIKLHVFTFNTVCTSFCPHFFLSLSTHPSVSSL